MVLSRRVKFDTSFDTLKLITNSAAPVFILKISKVIRLQIYNLTRGGFGSGEIRCEYGFFYFNLGNLVPFSIIF